MHAFIHVSVCVCVCVCVYVCVCWCACEMGRQSGGGGRGRGKIGKPVIGGGVESERASDDTERLLRASLRCQGVSAQSESLVPGSYQHTYVRTHETEVPRHACASNLSTFPSRHGFSYRIDVDRQTTQDLKHMYVGVSMLHAELAMAEGLMRMGMWDYLINLSSTDLPLHPRHKLLARLHQDYGFNFHWGVKQVSMPSDAR